MTHSTVPKNHEAQFEPLGPFGFKEFFASCFRTFEIAILNDSNRENISYKPAGCTFPISKIGL